VKTVQGRWESYRDVDPSWLLWEDDMLERRKCAEHRSRFILPDGEGYQIQLRKVSAEGMRLRKEEAFTLAGELVSNGNPEEARQLIRKVRTPSPFQKTI
jgi:hypothetical protein